MSVKKAWRTWKLRESETYRRAFREYAQRMDLDAEDERKKLKFWQSLIIVLLLFIADIVLSTAWDAFTMEWESVKIGGVLLVIFAVALGLSCFVAHFAPCCEVDEYALFMAEKEKERVNDELASVSEGKAAEAGTQKE